MSMYYLKVKKYNYLKGPFVFEGTIKQIERYMFRKNRHPSKKVNPLTYTEKYDIMN